MNWQPPSSPPKPYDRVWLKTSTGRETTGYINSGGEWVFNCRRVAVEKPIVLGWRE